MVSLIEYRRVHVIRYIVVYTCIEAYLSLLYAVRTVHLSYMKTGHCVTEHCFPVQTKMQEQEGSVEDKKDL